MPRYKLLIWFLIIFLVSSYGCESFRRKFIRKPKGEPKKEEMVIVPKDYSKLQLPVDQAYVQYYTYWKAWHNELLTFLSEGSSKKKVLSCFEQVTLNLNHMKDLLNNPEKISLLEKYLSEISSLADEVSSKTMVMVTAGRIKSVSEQLSRNIQRYFSLSKVKSDLKW
jgi:hypothetical protein